MVRVRGTAEKTCVVCGHSLGLYGRICDKCGSIQRPVGGDGLPVPPDRVKPCERCGQPMPAEDPEDVCEECAKTDAPGPIIWLDEEPDPYRKQRRAARIATGASAATTSVLALVMVFAGANAITAILLGFAVAALGASVASWIVISRRPLHKVEYFAPIKQDQVKTESSK
jgi:hypothetical protein